jgi:hypothetical protein
MSRSKRKRARATIAATVNADGVVTLWVTGNYVPPGNGFSLLGIFPSEAQAVEACTQPDNFVGPVPLGLRLPDAPQAWPGAYYPLHATTIETDDHVRTPADVPGLHAEAEVTHAN